MGAGQRTDALPRFVSDTPSCVGTTSPGSSMRPHSFAYDEAFSRNIGWVTEWEQSALRGKSVAIAGMGGVGGAHLLTLARLGIGQFRIADFDTFGIVNFNRQAGANVNTVGRPKLDVMAEMALAINPTLAIERFPRGVTAETIDAFLCGADLFVDGFDFFALQIRRQVFRRCGELGIPALTAAPIGLGTGYLAFVPGGMTFEQYFRLEGQPEAEQYLRFFMGVAPRGLHAAYLVDSSRIDLAAQKGPSTAVACELCAGVVGAMALQLLLRRGGIKPAPFHHHFDPYRGRFTVTRLPRGNDGASQRIRLALARRTLGVARPRADAEPTPASLVEHILTAARWAPSGDNSQPWRFEVLDDESVRVHLGTEAGRNPYDFRGGEPSVLSGGMLLESLRIAATQHGRSMEWRVEGRDDPYRIVVQFPAGDGPVDPLASVLSYRSVDRRPYRRRPLTAEEKAALSQSLGTALRVVWHEPRAQRLRIARLGAMATDIRLRARETFRVHQQVIDWTRGHSAAGLPALGIGLDRGTLTLMRWAMRRWSRMRALNRAFGTSAASLQLDLAPALGSAAFFTLEVPLPEGERVERLLRQGQAIQRFWLTASKLGLAMQPGLATLIFAQYGADDAAFTADASLRSKARRLAERFSLVLGRQPGQIAFLGRIGEPRSGLPKVRSTRQPLSSLLRRA